MPKYPLSAEGAPVAISAWMLCSKPNEATEIHRRSLALVHFDPPLFWPDDGHLTTQLVQGRRIPSPRLVRQENGAKKKLIRYGGVDKQIAFRRPLVVPRTQNSCRVPGALGFVTLLYNSSSCSTYRRLSAVHGSSILSKCTFRRWMVCLHP